MTILLISIAWLAALATGVGLLYWRRENDTPEAPTARSPRLLGPTRESFEQAIGQMLEASPVASATSKTPTAEHVGNGSQEDLYVRP